MFEDITREQELNVATVELYWIKYDSLYHYYEAYSNIQTNEHLHYCTSHKFINPHKTTQRKPFVK